jgi:hypothetical protein
LLKINYIPIKLQNKLILIKKSGREGGGVNGGGVLDKRVGGGHGGGDGHGGGGGHKPSTMHSSKGGVVMNGRW